MALQDRKIEGGALKPVVIARVLSGVEIGIDGYVALELNGAAVSIGNPLPVDQISQQAGSAYVHEPAANTAAVVTLAAPGVGVSNVIGMVSWSYDGVPVNGSLTIQQGGVTIFKVDITTSGPGFFQFIPALRCNTNAQVVTTLAAGGGGISGIVNVHTWTE